MTEPLTTEGLDVPDALELIAKWLREGRKLQGENKYHKTGFTDFGTNVIFTDYIYRPKPAKPRVINLFDTGLRDDIGGCGQVIWTTDGHGYVKTPFIELTTEVSAILEREGLL